MFDNYIQQLTSKDPAQRREAIIGLGKLGDPRALSYLGQVYKTDPDPTLRDLAAKAGRHIQKLKQSAPPTPPPPAYVKPFIDDEPPQRGSNLPDILANYTTPPADTYEPPQQAAPAVPDKYTDAPEASLLPITPLPPAQTQPPEIDISQAKPVSKQKQQQAKGRLNNAFTYKTRGDDQNALAELARALELDPGLADDRAAINLASSLVGGSGKESIALVLKKSQEKGGVKHRGAAAFDTEIWDMILSALILFVVIVLFSVAFFYATMIINRLVYELATKGTPQTAEMKQLLSEFSLQSILPDILRTTAVTVGSTVFQTIVIYLVGTMMGGVASFIRFAKVMMNVQTVFYIMIMVAFGVIFFGLFSGSDETFETMGGLGLLILGIVFLGGEVIQGYIAGRVQEFGFFKGIASVIVGSTAAGFFAGWTGMFNIRS